MTNTPARTERYAIVGFALGALSLLALLAAYCIVIRRWPPGLEGVGVTLYLCAFPISLVGILLSLATALLVVGYFLLSMIELSQAHMY